tara:strand:+ start:1758 stop:1982 length:225 start_codon:yes stop_codon:yes gene_type:complete
MRAYKKGDLVKFVKIIDELESDNSELCERVGIILDIATWPEYDQGGESITDLFIYWSNGEKYWCFDAAVIVVSN